MTMNAFRARREEAALQPRPWLDVPEARAWTGMPFEHEALPRVSPIEALEEAFEAQQVTKAASVAAYRALVKRNHDPIVAQLLQLVLEDQERHRNLLQRMSATLRDVLNWTRSPEAIPMGPAAADDSAYELLVAARARLCEERENGQQLRQLAKRDKKLYDGLFKVLLEMMAADAEEHESILRFVVQRLEAAAEAPEPSPIKVWEPERQRAGADIGGRRGAELRPSSSR